MATKLIKPIRAKKRLTRMTLSVLPPSYGRHEIRDSISLLDYRVTREGARSLSLRTRLHGKQIRVNWPGDIETRVKPSGGIEVDADLNAARAWAPTVVGKCRKGIDPREEDRRQEQERERQRLTTFAKVEKEFIRRHARKNKTCKETERLLNTYVLPEWGAWPVMDIGRRDVTMLLNKIEDGKLKIKDKKGKQKLVGGPTTADRVLAAIRKLFNWYATTDDDFVSPIVKGMARTKPTERARKRVLSDDDIRALWTATDQPNEAGGLDVYCAMVRTLLLTAQRRSKVNLMRRSQIDAKGVWEPARDDDGDNKQVGLVPLSQTARDLIDAQPIIGADDEAREDFVFTLDGKRPYNGWSKAKIALDGRMLATLQKRTEEAGEDPEKVTLPGWIHHDLRRTAKTLMIRAGVRPDISERVLGHVISGVEGVYDRHSYIDEKRDGLDKLATLVDRIINQPDDNVIDLRERA